MAPSLPCTGSRSLSSRGSRETQVIQNVDAIGRYKTIEIAAKSGSATTGSLVAGFGYAWTKEHSNSYAENTIPSGLGSQGFPQLANDPDVHEFTGCGFKAHGNNDAPYGICLRPIFRHQSGVPCVRTISGTAPVASGASHSANSRSSSRLERDGCPI